MKHLHIELTNRSTAQTIDFACVETQVGSGHALDCEIVQLGDGQVTSVAIPRL